MLDEKQQQELDAICATAINLFDCCFVYSNVAVVPENLAHVYRNVGEFKQELWQVLSYQFNAWSAGIDYALEHFPETINPLQVQ
jgi:hypothetical protein